MKKYCIMLATLLCLFKSHAQQNFDSAAYVSYYKTLFPSMVIDSVTREKDLSPIQKIEGLSMVWSEAKYNFANFDLVPELNWDSLYMDYIPRVTATKDIISYYNTLKSFNRFLHDGHSRIIEPPAYFFERIANVPLRFRLIDNKLVVTEINDTSTLYSGIRKGWIVEKIDQMPVVDYIAKYIIRYIHFSTAQDSISRICNYELLQGVQGSIVHVDFKDENNKTRSYTFTRKKLPDLPLVMFKILPGNIGYLQINSFGTEQTVTLFDSLFDTINTTDALIIDVRRNGGGNSNNGYEILGCLTNKPFNTDISVMRSYNPTERSWNNNTVTVQLNRELWKPYKNKYFNKPVVLLTDAATYSAAEDFTAAFKTMKRGTIIGLPTGGSTGQPLGYNLPGGGLGFVCSKRDYMSDGTEFVGKGIQPNILAGYTLKGIRSGKDEVLDAAVHFLQYNK